MKTALTSQIEYDLIKRTKSTLGLYGAFEVTIGHIGRKKGYERVDYLELNTKGDFTCYEIKVSLSDYLSKNKLSYVGNKNYLVAPKELAHKIKNEYNTHSHGIIAYDEKMSLTQRFEVIKRASNHTIGLGEKIELLESFAKSASRDVMKNIQ